MEIRKTTAFILKSIDWSETSKILTCISKDYGKITLLAKGAKRTKSMFRGLCEPLHEVDLIYDYKESRDIDLLREIDLKFNHSGKLSDKFTHLYYSLAIVELIDRLFEQDDETKEIFLNMSEFMSYMDKCSHPESYFFKFFILLINELGYRFSFFVCGSCDNKLTKQFQYQISYGIVCENCLNENQQNIIGQNMFACFQALEKLDLSQVDKVSINVNLQKEMLNILFGFLEYHLGFKLRLKSLEFVLNT